VSKEVTIVSGEDISVSIVTAQLSKASGGVGYAVAGVASALSGREGVSVQVVGLADSLSPERLAMRSDGVFLLSTFGPRRFGWAPRFSATLDKLNTDIADAQGLWMYPSLANLNHHRRTCSPYIITPHGMLDPWAVERSCWRKRIVSWLFESEHLRKATCLRATAAMEGGHFRAYGLKNPIAVVPNGVDLPVLAHRPYCGDRPRRLLFLSRIHPKKGIGVLLRAWARLNKLRTGWELLIVGPDELGHRLQMQSLAEELSLTDIVWLDEVHGLVKSNIYRSADLFVLPTHAENFGLVVAEALAHEVPVITSRNAPWGGLEQYQCGWWIDLSVDALVVVLDEAMSLSDAERLAMGERGRVWVAQDFTWAAIARQMHEIYTWVLGGGPPPACVMTD
jgi:glycosyltransferase involved in cell wall biosynthesis